MRFSKNNCPPLFRYMLFDSFESIDDMKAIMDGYVRNVLLGSAAILLFSYVLPFFVPFRIVVIATILCSSATMLVGARSQTPSHSVYLLPLLFVLDAIVFLVLARTVYQIGVEAELDTALNIAAISALLLLSMIWRIAADITFFLRARTLVRESRP